MPKVKRIQYIQCIHCNIRIPRNMPCNVVLELDSIIMSVVCEWISPVIATEEDYICNKCVRSAQQAINSRLKGEPEVSPLQISHACAICGRKLKQTKWLLIRKEPTELQTLIRNETEKRIAPRQITTSDSLCICCSSKIKYYITRIQGYSVIQDSADQNVSTGQKTSIDQKPDIELSLQEPTVDQEKSTCQEVFIVREPHVEHHIQESTVAQNFSMNQAAFDTQEYDKKLSTQEPDLAISNQETDFNSDSNMELQNPSDYSDHDISTDHLSVDGDSTDLECTPDIFVPKVLQNFKGVSHSIIQQDCTSVSNKMIPKHCKFVAHDSKTVSNEITLNNYRRAANTANRCIFYGCRNKELKRISDTLRATVIQKCNYYIPNKARVCTEHLEQNTWEGLFGAKESINVFTAEHVEHVFSLLKTESIQSKKNISNMSLHFSNIHNFNEMDNDLFEYFTGMKKTDVRPLLNVVPRIKEMPKGILGLGALIKKMNTGISNDRLSQLLLVSRSTLKRHMNKVKGILLEDLVLNNLGNNHLGKEQFNLVNKILSVENRTVKNKKINKS